MRTGILVVVAAVPASSSLRRVRRTRINFFLTKEKAVEQCLDGIRTGKLPGPCPDAVAQGNNPDRAQDAPKTSDQMKPFGRG